MKISPRLFHNLLAELADENPIACRGVLTILGVRFTTDVDTLEVSLTSPPELLVNLEFLAKHAKTEADVKAVILHEFLHVLLNHTEKFETMNDALNVALDSVINNIIQRTCGDAYGDFFRTYYQHAAGALKLLRPLATWERGRSSSLVRPDLRDVYSTDQLRAALFDGRILADDILDLLKSGYFSKLPLNVPKNRPWLGGHEPLPGEGEIAPEAREALEGTLRRLNGDGIYRSPRDHGVGANPYETLVDAQAEKPRRDWERAAWSALREHVTPDPFSTVQEKEERESSLPVLNERDRRAFLRSLWSPLIPDVSWAVPTTRPVGTCQVYLDVSGSMNNELSALVGLLNRLKRFIRLPFWAFSDEVVPAVIEQGRLITDTSGGTSMNAVLEHVVQTRPGKAVVITDGYIESCDPVLLTRMARQDQRLFAIVSRDGSTGKLDEAGIPARQLPHYQERRR